MDFKDLVTQRFSARKYTTEAVSDKQLHWPPLLSTNNPGSLSL